MAVDRVDAEGGLLRAGEFGYQDAGTAIGMFTTREPYELTVTLDQLR